MHSDQSRTDANPQLIIAAGVSALPTHLVQDYLRTEYKVYASEGSTGWTLKVGNKSEELWSLMHRSNAQGAAYITACNPLGQALSDGENKLRHNTLRAELDRLGLDYLEGAGQGVDTAWPAEESFLILNTDFVVANRLARDFKQNAYVWSDPQAIPQLVLLR